MDDLQITVILADEIDLNATENTRNYIKKCYKTNNILIIGGFGFNDFIITDLKTNIVSRNNANKTNDCPS